MNDSLFNYNIIKLLGEGGMSRVFLAEDPLTHQQVAIKELLPNLAHNKDLRERFRREAQIMAKLDHPNIVKLLRYEESENSFYLIMEYADGIDLENHIKNVTGPISEPKTVEIMSALLDAFGYAHEKGVVHRDIKPANIIITRDGKVKVLDFGIAKMIDDNSGNKTKTGTRIGTVSYMSPEQINAAPDIDLRTDIYSLGVLLHQMITGMCPYDSNTTSDFEIQTKIVKEPLPRADSIYPYVSEHLQQIIDKATQKNRDNRYQDCDQFKLALISKNNVSNWGTTSPAQNFNRQQKRKKGTNSIWIVISIISLLIVIAIVGTVIYVANIPKTAADDYSPTDSIAVDSTASTDYNSDETTVDSTAIATDNEPSNYQTDDAETTEIEPTEVSVNVKKAYFYEYPDYSSRTNQYCVEYNYMECTKIHGDFLYVTFTNDDGITTSGWMIKDELNY